MEGVPAQAEGAVTRLAAEALAVEEVALCAQPLHDVHPLAAKMAGVASRVPTRHTLEEEEEEEYKVTPELHEDAPSCVLKQQVQDVQETPEWIHGIKGTDDPAAFTPDPSLNTAQAHTSCVERTLCVAISSQAPT